MITVEEELQFLRHVEETRAEDERAAFLADVLEGLSRGQKEIPCKWLYDARGSHLFEQICDLEEYYPTRTELGILERHVRAMASLLGPECALVEYGAGSGAAATPGPPDTGAR